MPINWQNALSLKSDIGLLFNSIIGLQESCKCRELMKTPEFALVELSKKNN